MDSKLERYGPLAGIVFAVLLTIGAALVANGFEYLPPPDEIQAFLEDNSSRLAIGAYIFSLSAFFLIWFVGSLRSSLRRAEGENGLYSAIALGAGVAASGVLLVGASAIMSAGARAGTEAGISLDSAATLSDLYGTVLGNGFPIAFAALTGSAAVVWFRTGVFPRWLAWASAVLTLGLLSPVNYIFGAIAILWTAVVSVLLYMRGGSDSSTGD